ncbi:GIY-YIG nuclease family protein [Candidatus Daviesbacteria bacterium]|nr:GIY-YIG nuclease family protein [Candidatus Daviesbacteria bacterium]
MYYVYVLRSLKNGRFYTGSTNNLERRLNEHNTGQSKYTKLTAPFALVYKEEYKTKEEAYKKEMYYKTGAGREKIKDILMRE